MFNIFKNIKKLDFIVTDSKECKEVLIQNFPSCKEKFKIIFNIVSPTLIHKLAEEPILEHFPSGLKIVSIGRLENQKGYDFAVDALKIVKQKGFNFHWIILGEGIEKPKLVQQIDSTITNVNKATIKLNENLEALKHNFLFRGYFKKQAKEKAKQGK